MPSERWKFKKKSEIIHNRKKILKQTQQIVLKHAKKCHPIVACL